VSNFLTCRGPNHHLIFARFSHHAPRAKKHIKALLKRRSELEKQVIQQESSISKTEALIAKLSNPEEVKEVANSVTKKKAVPTNVDEEIRKLQASIRREQMEILAVEQTTEDLLEKVSRRLVLLIELCTYFRSCSARSLYHSEQRHNR
jgi:vacuolar-type H+-ATPase subunit I/STV1